MNAVKLLAILVGITAVTLLCIRSGQAMAKTPFERAPADDQSPVVSVAHNLGKLFSVTAPDQRAVNETITPTVNATSEVPADAIPTPKAVEELALENDAPGELSQGTGRSMYAGTIGEDSFAVGQAMSKKRNQPFVPVRGKRTKPKHILTNHRYDDDDEDDDDHDVILDAGVYHSSNNR